jgi:hypothetical protein
LKKLKNLFSKKEKTYYRVATEGKMVIYRSRLIEIFIHSFRCGDTPPQLPNMIQTN